MIVFQIFCGLLAHGKTQGLMSRGFQFRLHLLAVWLMASYLISWGASLRSVK